MALFYNVLQVNISLNNVYNVLQCLQVDVSLDNVLQANISHDNVLQCLQSFVMF